MLVQDVLLGDAGSDVSIGRPVGTTRDAGSNVSTGCPIGTTRDAGSNVSTPT